MFILRVLFQLRVTQRRHERLHAHFALDRFRRFVCLCCDNIRERRERMKSEPQRCFVSNSECTNGYLKNKEREREKTKKKTYSACSQRRLSPLSPALSPSLWLIFGRCPRPWCLEERDERKRKERIGVKNCSELLFFPSLKTLARVYWFFTAMVRF